MIEYIGRDVIDAYYKNVIAQGINVELCATSGLRLYIRH